ncbi:glycosyl hydrolase family 18 protein [Actinomycetospora sp.]|jgi:spore germination protein YaaH|uniref:glycosyl hydrolase family 18 protein n=1 Tax=Actinomycetospora sp. TaxID=1872135 RepID=UPI002F424799
MRSAGTTPGLRAVTIPSWNLGPGARDVAAHAVTLDEVSPGTHRIRHDGGVAMVARDDAGAVATLRSTGLALMPTVSNLLGGRRSRDVVSATLHDPDRTRRHVLAIRDLVVGDDYAGIDIDYQGLHRGDRQAFSRFVARLADALHEHGRRLSVTVYAKADEHPDEPPTLVDDYGALGAAADEVRLTSWDYHDPTTVAGPPAPSGWVRDVLAHAAEHVPAGKLLVGVTGSGYDWTREGAVPVSHAEAIGLAVRHASGRVEVDPLAETPWFRYLDPAGTAHEVWFEDARSVAVKLRGAAAIGVGGVLLRLAATPDEGVWAELAEPGSGVSRRG